MRAPGLAEVSTDIADLVLDFAAAPVLHGHAAVMIHMSFLVGSVGTHLQILPHHRRNNMGRREACLTWQLLQSCTIGYGRSFQGSNQCNQERHCEEAL